MCGKPLIRGNRARSHTAKLWNTLTPYFQSTPAPNTPRDGNCVLLGQILVVEVKCPALYACMWQTKARQSRSPGLEASVQSRCYAACFPFVIVLVITNTLRTRKIRGFSETGKAEENRAGAYCWTKKRES